MRTKAVNWYIYPRTDGWGLRKGKLGRTIAVYRLRRDALSEAKAQIKKCKGMIYVHNASGLLVMMIPESGIKAS